MSDTIDNGTEEAGYPPTVGIYTMWHDSQMVIRIHEKNGSRRIDNYEEGQLVDSLMVVPEKDMLLSIDYRNGGVQDSFSLKKTVRMADGKPPKRKSKVKSNSIINWHETGTCIIDDRECRILEWRYDGRLKRRRHVDKESNYFRQEISYDDDGSIMKIIDWIMEDENPPEYEVFTAEWKPAGYQEPE
ncbi:hypothetical protein Pla110_18180 [Polystyrenella longa]|uniref:Uncharacterized protein n=1 Tax=Polystyrenella longa TaxID=2528007 RepID=A0A518CLK1_9PLAN|nr:hypothetical protein [Polystyrenella longa]QDU80096.1 hypothetical protein Pla110_18180 [Polystyrenella longa]